MQSGSRNIGKKNGFTLIELLVVLVIVGILAAIVAPSVYQRVNPARQAAAKAQMQSFATALESYYVDMGRYPNMQEGLAVLVQAPSRRGKWAGPYLKREVPPDPWGNPYLYRVPGKIGPYEIVSLGADAKSGGGDEGRDLYSWESE